jgi:hypothetical protein
MPLQGGAFQFLKTKYYFELKIRVYCPARLSGKFKYFLLQILIRMFRIRTEKKEVEILLLLSSLVYNVSEFH